MPCGSWQCATSAIGWKLSLVVRQIYCHLRYYIILFPTEFPRFLHWCSVAANTHDDVKWKHFPHHGPFVREIQGSRGDSFHKGRWRGALMIYLICGWTNGWANSRNASDLRRNRSHYDSYAMFFSTWSVTVQIFQTDNRKLFYDIWLLVNSLSAK